MTTAKRPRTFTNREYVISGKELRVGMMINEIDAERRISDDLAAALLAARDRLRTYLTRGGKSEVLRQADGALARWEGES